MTKAEEKAREIFTIMWDEGLSDSQARNCAEITITQIIDVIDSTSNSEDPTCVEQRKFWREVLDSLILIG